MSIIRAPRPEARFYTLDKSISEDARLSWGARGLLIFLLGKPDNWEVSVKHLINQTQDAIGKASGRDAVRVILKELEEAGYLKVDIARADGGAFNGMAYTVSEIPDFQREAANPAPAEPETDNPAPDKPAPANPHLTNTEDKQDTDTEEKTSLSSLAKEVFDHWRWAMNSPRSKMDDKRKALILKALKLYSVDDLKRAIDGCAISPFHMGANDRKEKYNGLDLILRNAEKIDAFIAKAERPPVAPKASAINQTFSEKNYQGTSNDQFADAFQ
jgi:hypothetical protein